MVYCRYFDVDYTIVINIISTHPYTPICPFLCTLFGILPKKPFVFSFPTHFVHLCLGLANVDELMLPSQHLYLLELPAKGGEIPAWFYIFDSGIARISISLIFVKKTK